MRLCLVEDDDVTDLEPLTLARPMFEQRLGAGTIGSKIERAFRVDRVGESRGALIRPHLVATQRERDPRMVINDPRWLAAGPTVLVNARWVPPAEFSAPRKDKPWMGLCEGEPACALVYPDQAAALEWGGIETLFENLSDEVECRDVGGEWIRRPWDLVGRNSDHLVRDFAAAGATGVSADHLAKLALVGPIERLSIHETARIDPFTVFDTTNGPITIEADVWVQPFTRVEGPCFVGRATQLFRANLRGGVTLGPNCRIGGEVEASIVHGHSNKYHEGFLGHAYVGEWVNLGAITSNSDLRNDYGEVLVPLSGSPIATGQAKVGCFLGDHTRTGMGCMLNTGTAVGVMCNLLPGGPLLPKYVPSFAAVLYGRVAPGFSLARLLDTARTVKGRRGKEFSAADEQLYLDLYEQTRPERERSFQCVNDRRGDHWPAIAVRA
jgi:UDP-N-acetylglucosamine diphosphorylase / glucose-1-phosphate thymidylyltransferase / UDP-N-acetylgalactosamine diphosphorylase / glucosamine-1-phosphate N-acetyltransferase / galactosamine-1-phosphate N-acetyltransferase